jgi:hypothetical protein
MTHYGDDILELFVLGSAETRGKKRSIENHLKRCAGCKQRVEEMRAYYSGLEEGLHAGTGGVDTPELLPAVPTPSWVAKPALTSIEPAPPRGTLSHLVRFVRYRPITTSATLLAVLAALAIFGVYRFEARKDDNPTSVRLNPAKQVVTVLGARNRILFTIPAHDADLLEMLQEEHGTKTSVLADLNGDGMNDVVTIADPHEDGTGTKAFVSVYGFDGTLRWRKELGGPLFYGQKPYAAHYNSSGVRVVEDEKGSPRIVVAVVGSRSPSLLAVLSSEGTLIGEYWHFGTLFGPDTMDLDGDGIPELFLWGENDVADTSGGDSPVIVVLDPSKIQGKTESALTPGFGHKRSTAELKYLRLPKAQIDSVRAVKSGVTRLAVVTVPGGGPGLSAWVSGGRTSFEYLFTADLQPIAVFSSDFTTTVFNELQANGARLRPIDAAHLEDMKKAIRYWDGSRWTPLPTRISPSGFAGRVP